MPLFFDSAFTHTKLMEMQKTAYGYNKICNSKGILIVLLLMVFVSCSNSSSGIEKRKGIEQGGYTVPTISSQPQDCSTPHPPNNTPKASRTVYICTGPRAYAYHYDEWCSGLNRCNYEIQTTTEANASQYRSPCRICVE